MRTLMLLRHGKTEDSRPGHRDDARRLTPAGERQAAELGDYLRREHVQVDVVLCSSATRARQTVERAWIGGAGGRSPTGCTRPAATRSSLSSATSTTTSSTCWSSATLPALPAVAQELADPDTSDPEALDTLERRFPAGALATLSVNGTWSELDRASLMSIRLP